MNAKPIFGIPKAHKPWLQLSGFHFDEKAFKKDISLLLTCIRGKTILDSSDSRLLSLFDEFVFLGNVIKHTKTLEAKQICSHYSYYLNQGAATVSYSGYTKFGSVEKHIKNIEIFAEYPTPLFEIAFANGCFYFTISANFKFDKYAEKIVSIFNDELGFECSEVRKFVLKASARPNKYPKLGFNKGTIDALLAFLKYLKHRNGK